MINTRIGHCEVKLGGKSYLLVPSLINISKIGSPKEIISAFAHVDNPARFNYKLEDGKLNVVNYSFSSGFEWAAHILQCCGLPKEITGWLYFREENGFPCFIPVEGKVGFHDVFVLAAHCLTHGVCGIVKESDNQDPMKEFDAFFYINLARKVLGISMEEAQNMTMTELSMHFDANQQIDSGAKAKEAELSNQKSAFSWYEKKKEAK